MRPRTVLVADRHRDASVEGPAEIEIAIADRHEQVNVDLVHAEAAPFAAQLHPVRLGAAIEIRAGDDIAIPSLRQSIDRPIETDVDLPLQRFPRHARPGIGLQSVFVAANTNGG